MSRDPNDGAPPLEDVGLTRRRLMQVTGGTLLGSAVFGTVTDVSSAAVGDGRNPSPGDVDWDAYVEDPQVVGENVEPPHAPTMPYGSLSAAREAERSREFLTEQWLESEYVTTLDGVWKFHLAESFDAAPSDLSEYREWNSVYVPHTWHMDGYGELEYQSSGTGFDPNDSPAVPDESNRVGTYRREFDVPDGWTDGRQTFLKVGAAKSGYFVWVNEEYVGYKQGSMTPGEFNVTDAVDPSASNTVTIQVARWTDGTYLEQQDMWRFAGIFRDVLLYSKPNLCVRDVHAVTDLDSSYTDGSLEIDVAVADYADGRRRGRGPPDERGSGNSPGEGRGHGPPDDPGTFGRRGQTVTLRAHLYDPAGAEVATADRRVRVRPGSVVSLDGGSADGVHDLSREANDATLRGAPRSVDGRYGGALAFDGRDDWADAGNDSSLDITDSVTVEAIVEIPERPEDAAVPLVTKAGQYRLHLAGGEPRFTVSDGTNDHGVAASTPDDWAGEWHRLTGVYDGSTLKLYVDGAEAGTSSYSGDIASTDANVAVGRNVRKKGSYGRVTVASARIYDRALPADEVASVRTVPSHSTRLWLDFDEVQSGDADPITLEVPDVETWTAEDPSLYTLGIELRQNGSRAPTEALVDKVGFRTLEIGPAADGTGRAVRVNGKQVTLAGTNVHSLSLDHGRHTPLERVRKGIELAKRNNVNALRTSHYPHRPDFYRLADEYGIYVQDEVNAEAHGNQSLVNDRYGFDPSFFDRFYRMVERDKNFASINVWSTGNEAGLGPAHHLMAAYVEERDGTRHITHQDNAGGFGAGFGGTAPFADLNGVRWSIPEDVAEMAESDDVVEPIAMGEYAPVEGNSGGLFPDFGDIIYEYDQVAGGYAWMWNHHSLNSTKTPDEEGVLTDTHRRAAVDDRSVSGLTAMVRGAPSTVSGPSGTALALDGDGDWVDANDDDRIDLTGELTVEAVIYGDTPGDGRRPIVTKGDTQYALRFDDGDLAFAAHDGSDARRAVAPLPDDWTGAWHTVTGVYDGSALRLYVDGDHLASTRFPGEIRSNRHRLAVGHNAESGRHAAVTVNSVRLFERPLSADEAGADSPDDSTRLWLDFDVREHFWSSPYGATHHAPSGTVHDDRYTLPTIDVMKQSYQFVRFSADDLTAGRVTVANHYDFTGLGAFDVKWELKADDAVVQRGTVDADVPPGEARMVDVGYDRPELTPGTDYFLDLSVERSAATSWSPAGHEVAREQFEIPWESPDPPAVALSEMPAVSYSTDGSGVTVSGEDFTYVFDADAGRFTSLRRHGEELLERGPQVNAWREPVRPNETSDWGGAEATDFTAAGLDEMTASVRSSDVSKPDDAAVRIDVETLDSADGNDAAFETTYRYHVLGSGDIVARVSVSPNVALVRKTPKYLPRIGLRLRTPESFDRFEWYGRGPGESYPDKKRHQRVGRYAGSVADQFEPYLPPGDYGNKCDTRYAAVTNDDGVGLLVHGLPGTETMNVSVQEFVNMWEADHHYQLESADGVVFNVDYGVSGVGGIPNSTRPPYRVAPTDTEFVYAFRPFDASEEDPLALSKRALPFSESSGAGDAEGPLRESTYWAENVNSGKAMDVYADDVDQNGANVIQWEYWSSANQQWLASRNDDGTYRFVNLESGKVLAADSSDVVQWEWNGADDQRWRVVETGDETYRVENVANGGVLTVNNGSAENGADVVTAEWTSRDAQKWVFNAL